MGRLMFFLFMPIIFEFICFLISYFNLNWSNSLKQEIGLFSVLLLIDYIIEFIYLIIIKKNLGVWIFDNSFNDECESYSMFVTLSIAYIIVTIFFGLLFSVFDDGMPIAHTIVLIICFTIFCIIEVSMIHENKDDKTFELLAYQEEQNTIYLHAMGDGHEISGEINGRSHLGTGWIHGKIETNYSLYYAFIDNGRVVIRSILYNENNVNIYEIGDSGEPRIIFHRYYKSYNCEKGHYKYDEYYIYDIYIPSILSSIKIDMEQSNKTLVSGRNLEVIGIFNWDNLIDKIHYWVHKNPNDIEQIENRGMIVAVSPVFIGFAIGLILVLILKVVGL